MILRAEWVVPLDGLPIRGGQVQVCGERIVAVGPAVSAGPFGPAGLAASAGPAAPADSPPAAPPPRVRRRRAQRRTAEPPEQSVPPAEEVLDLGEAILMPGLVNPHTHLELTCYAGRLAPAAFWDWLPQLVTLRAAAGQVEREQQAAHDGAWQSLRAGVTCVGDISRRNLSWPVLGQIPIRKICFVELLTLADHAPRDLAELRAAIAAVEEDPLLTVGATPHTPYTVTGEQFAGTIALAHALNRPWCTHWAETREECAFLRGGAPGLHPFLDRLLAQCGIASPRRPPIAFLEACTRGRRPGLLAHCNYPDPGDAERLAAAGHCVVYCPRAHRFFGHAPHPYRTLRAAGVTVAIGTDSTASNESLAPLEELRYLRSAAAGAGAAEAHTAESVPSPADLLAMVTRDAARALGLAEQIGTLTPSKQADLAAFPCPAGIDDPLAYLVDVAPRPSAVWVAGRRVVG